MRRVLITGSKGPLGTDCNNVFQNVTSLSGADLPEVDLSNRSQCIDLLDRIQPETMVNCATFTAVDFCESDPSCWKANADMPGYLAEWVEQNAAFLVHHISTDYDFTGDKLLFEPLVESDVPNSISEYGRSKLAISEHRMRGIFHASTEGCEMGSASAVHPLSNWGWNIYLLHAPVLSFQLCKSDRKI